MRHRHIEHKIVLFHNNSILSSIRHTLALIPFNHSTYKYQYHRIISLLNTTLRFNLSLLNRSNSLPHQATSHPVPFNLMKTPLAHLHQIHSGEHKYGHCTSTIRHVSVFNRDIHT